MRAIGRNDARLSQHCDRLGDCIGLDTTPIKDRAVGGMERKYRIFLVLPKDRSDSSGVSCRAVGTESITLFNAASPRCVVKRARDQDTDHIHASTAFPKHQSEDSEGWNALLG